MVILDRFNLITVKMNSNIYNYLYNICFFFGTLLILSSCAEEDEFLKYVGEGERIYSGKMDSVMAFSGDNRILLRGLLSPDPKLSSYTVFWANRRDSVQFPIDKNRINDSINQVIEDLPENIYNFEIRTYDTANNSSVPTYVTGKVYGERYKASLRNRPLTQSSLMGDSVQIAFVEADVTSGIVSTEIEYKNSLGRNELIKIPLETSSLTLRNFMEGNAFKYRSVYKPDSLSIDSFFTAYDSIVPSLPISEPPYLENSSQPFKIANDSGQRYSTPASWIHNTAALIYHGSYGNIDKQGGDVMNMVSGYGGVPDLVNAKIFQRLNLNAGTYTYTVHTSAGNWNTEDQLYILAALGSELPDVSEIEDSDKTLEFIQISENIGAMNNYVYQFNFELSELSQVTLGIIASNKPGTNKYMPIKNFSLVKN
ncbi:DUF4998 domain-containing protein [Leeuwenhoekiella sp. ZYFB001]|uniref:DUF4998 domain-containing protein n=1 Tax=Leeuwenhoekiella sp. ZYFB001 TaxID=2719912 RepID=UPI0014305C96|nr:DUF4998 domain-containing protein [Leeuwenhoekiella sp. ZYFB001]